MANLSIGESNITNDSNLITRDELIEAIANPEAREAFANMTIDRTSAFLSGQSTSAFTKAFAGEGNLLPESLAQNEIGATINNLTKTTAILTNLASLTTRLGADAALVTGKSWGDTESGQQSTSDLWEDAVNELIQYAINKITADIIKYTQQAITKVVLLTKAAPSKILAATIKHFNKKKLSYEDILKQLQMDQEIWHKKKLETSLATKQNNLLTNITTTINDALVKVNKKAMKAAEYVKLATEYIEEGPDHLTTVFNDIYTDATQYAQDYLNIACNYATTQVNKVCDSIGEMASEPLAAEYNKFLIRQANKIYYAQTDAETTALTKSFAAKYKTISKIIDFVGFS